MFGRGLVGGTGSLTGETRVEAQAPPQVQKDPEALGPDCIQCFVPMYKPYHRWMCPKCGYLY